MSSRIADLSSTIAHHTALIDKYLAANQLSQPSFASDGPVTLGLTDELEQSRNVVVQATQELNELMIGPREIVFGHDHNPLVYLHLIYRFRIAHLVPIDGAKSFADLAQEVGIEVSALTRILRLAIAHRIFTEPEAGVIAHSAASRLIREDERVEAWVGCGVGDMWPAAMRTVDALVKWPNTSEPNQTGFSLANNSSLSFYQELEKDPQRATRFAKAMSFFTGGPEFSLQHLVTGFDWSSLPANSTVVDIGGSHGGLAFALAHAHPELKLIVQDLPAVVSSCQPRAGINVAFQAHDFFEEQTVNADVYILRWILHNWADAQCTKILRNIIPALKSNSRILVMDMIMPPPGVLPNGLERKVRAVDLTMMEVGNAKERDVEEWKELFEKADERFAWKGAKVPVGSRLGVLEWVWEG